MTKAELVAKIAKDAELTRFKLKKQSTVLSKQPPLLLKLATRLLSSVLVRFSAVNRAARIGRNPQNGKQIKIAEKTNGKFTPGKALKDLKAKPVKATPKAKKKAKKK